MSNRETCHALIDQFNEGQLANVVGLLNAAKTLADESADDAFCMRLYADYEDAADKGSKPLSAFAQDLGVSLQ